MKLNLTKQNEWQAMMRWGVEDGAFPGGVLLIGNHAEILYHQAFGSAQVIPDTRPATTDTIYDLASLTKVICTTTLMMQLIERGKVRLDDPVERYFPGFAVHGKENVRLRHLLTHCSGLPAWKPLYLAANTNEERLAYIKNLELDYATGTNVIYSDLGFILLGEMVAQLYNRPLDEVAQTQIFTPLQMEETCYNPPRDRWNRIAPTEVNNDFETEMSHDTAGIARREGVILGEVHDTNCYTMGGVTGHAGLFAPAYDLYHFVKMLLNRGEYKGRQILSPRMVEAMLQNYTSHIPGDNRGLGWDKPAELCSGGDLLTPMSIGHTGFTGTSIWIDPISDLAVVLLTNRVHPTCSTKHIRFRPLLHNLIFGSLEV
jgi:CubicO group peptidase (beta-lactamase class C family)